MVRTSSVTMCLPFLLGFVARGAAGPVPGLRASGALEIAAADGTWPDGTQPFFMETESSSLDWGAHRATVHVTPRPRADDDDVYNAPASSSGGSEACAEALNVACTDVQGSLRGRARCQGCALAAGLGGGCTDAEERAFCAAPKAVLAELQWRRRDVRPMSKDVRVTHRRNATDAQPVEVMNRVVLSLTGSVGRVLFDANRGPGLYDIYYLPFISNGQAFGRKDTYLPFRRNGTSSVAWLEALARKGWILNEDLHGANPASFVEGHTPCRVVSAPSFAAQTPHDRFSAMEVAATDPELDALYGPRRAKGEPAVLIPYSNTDVVRSFAFVSTRYLEYPQSAAGAAPGAPVWKLPRTMLLSAAPNQYLVWQLAVVAIYDTGRSRWPNITNIRVTYTDLHRASPATGKAPAGIGMVNTIPAANLSCFNVDGVDQAGLSFTLRPRVNTTLGSILPLWLGIDIGSQVTGGTFAGTATVMADVDGAANAWTAAQQYAVTVGGEPLSDRGDSNATLLSRVRWLNSRFGLDVAEGGSRFAIPAPFTPIKAAADGGAPHLLKLFNKNISLASTGFPQEITVATPPYAPREVIGRAGGPVRTSIPGWSLAPASAQLNMTKVAPDRVAWAAASTLSNSTMQGPDATGANVTVRVNGFANFDGYTEYVVRIEPGGVGVGASSIAVPDVRVSIPLSRDACRYVMKGGGSGVPIGNASSFDWSWTPGHSDNLFWIGSVQAGLRLRLRGPEYAWYQPRGPYHYEDLPTTSAGLPRVWNNNGSGGVAFRAAGVSGGCMLEAFTGPLTVTMAHPAVLHFDLLITPNKPADISNRLKKLRYYQMESKLETPATLHDDKVKIVTVHQGNSYNPWIIYPLDPVANAAARNFSLQMRPSKTKTYYSSGSLSYIAPELWAFFSLYGEVITAAPGYVDPLPPPMPPPGSAEARRWATVAEAAATAASSARALPQATGPHHWFSEHAGTALFSSDWTTPLSERSRSPVCDGCDMDVSFTTRANSRLANFWSRLLVPASADLVIDGIYLDGVAYDSPTILRGMRAVSAGRGLAGMSGGMVDLHCGNRWPSGKGEINALEYAQHMSISDSIMFGEGFNSGGAPCGNWSSGICGGPDWMMLATSGLQFGLFNDMLQDPNLFRGMVFGMFGRPPYSNATVNRNLYSWIDEIGLGEAAANGTAGTEMLGYWADQEDWSPVVTSSHPDVKVTAYLVQPTTLRKGLLVLAVANWLDTSANYSITIDKSAVAAKIPGWGVDGSLRIHAPGIPLVQDALNLPSLSDLTVVPRGGMLIEIDTKSAAAATGPVSS